MTHLEDQVAAVVDRLSEPRLYGSAGRSKLVAEVVALAETYFRGAIADEIEADAEDLKHRKMEILVSDLSFIGGMYQAADVARGSRRVSPPLAGDRQ